MSAHLLRGLDDRELDVVLAKRLPGRSQGRLLFSQPLVWCGEDGLIDADVERSVPIVTYVEPSTVRDLILGALNAAGRRSSIVVECGGLAGIQAAVAAGMGITAFSDGFVPRDLRRLPDTCGLPPAGRVEYVIDRRGDPSSEALDAFVAVLSSTASLAADLRG